MWRRIVVVMLVVLCAAAARAADGPFTLEQVMSAPFPSDLTAAAKGSRVAWVFDAQGKRNIWVAEGPQFVARQLTRFKNDDGQEITDVEFSADGNSIVFVRGGNKNQAGEVPNPTSDPEGADQAIWAVAWAGGAPRKIDLGRNSAVSPGANWVAYIKENQLWVAPVTGAGKPRQVIARGTNISPMWSPNGKLLAFVSNRTTHSFIGIYEPVKRTLGFLSPTVDRDTAPRWSADGKSIAFLRSPAREAGQGGGGGGFGGFGGTGGAWAVMIAEVGARDVNLYAIGKEKEIWRSSGQQANTAGAMPATYAFQWAGDRFVFSSEKDGWMHLYSMPATGGEWTLLTPGDCEYESMAFTPDKRSILFTSNCGDIDRRHMWRVSTSGGTPEAVSRGEGIEMYPVITGDGKWIVYLGSGARQPNMPYAMLANGTGEPKLLAAKALPKDFPSEKIVAPQQVIVDAADGMKIHCQLFLPAGVREGQRAPAVVFMHGGPIRQMLLGWHYMYYYRNSYAFNQYLASRGYVVLSVNYRSGIGYGRDFRLAQNRGAAGASEYQDIVAAGKYLAGRPDVDPAKIGLWGGSYGGYLTAMGLARNSDLFAAGVDLHGVHDWSRRVGGGGGAAAAAAQQDATRLKLARDSSPVAAVSTWKSPVLLIQGDDDRNVDFGQMVDLVPRLRQQKVEFEQIVFPDEVHDFLMHLHWMTAYRAAASFFDKHLMAGTSRAAAGNE